MMRSHRRPEPTCLQSALSVTLLWLVSLCAYADTVIPDEFYIPEPERNPGFITPRVTQDNLPDTVCDAGWTKTVRPTTKYTKKLNADRCRTAVCPALSATIAKTISCRFVQAAIQRTRETCGHSRTKASGPTETRTSWSSALAACSAAGRSRSRPRKRFF